MLHWVELLAGSSVLCSEFKFSLKLPVNQLSKTKIFLTAGFTLVSFFFQVFLNFAVLAKLVRCSAFKILKILDDGKKDLRIELYRFTRN